MAGKVRPIHQLADFFRSEVLVGTRRAAAVALLETTVAAESQAKRGASKTFRGTRDRPKTGNLLNAIFSAFELGTGGKLAQGFVAVRSNKGNAGTRPYGRIHEYGGTIVPVKAKNLWIPLFGPKTRLPGDLHNMTPRDFMELKKNPRGHVGGISAAILPGGVAGIAVKGKGLRAKFTALFLLRKRVVIPARPYITPAIQAELPKYGARFRAALKKKG